MNNESSGACAAEPLKELPLKGYYGGKPTRISIEFDDHSSQNIGNADGSVDRIVENLTKRADQPDELTQRWKELNCAITEFCGFPPSEDKGHAAYTQMSGQNRRYTAEKFFHEALILAEVAINRLSVPKREMGDDLPEAYYTSAAERAERYRKKWENERRVSAVLRQRLDKYEPPKAHDPGQNGFLKEIREVSMGDEEQGRRGLE